jgi:hypothetical protein
MCFAAHAADQARSGHNKSFTRCRYPWVIAGLVPLTAITHCELPVGDEPAGIFVPSQMIGLPNSAALDGSRWMSLESVGALIRSVSNGFRTFK